MSIQDRINDNIKTTLYDNETIYISMVAIYHHIDGQVSIQCISIDWTDMILRMATNFGEGG